MTNFASGYHPPGVYVTADNSAVSGAVGVQDTVVCIVGPGLGYQTFTDFLNFPSLTTPLQLTQLGVQQGSVVVSYLDPSGNLVTLTSGTDYTVTSTDGSAPDTVTTITPVGTGAMPVNTQITVAYNYANANYFGLNAYSDFATLSSVYGAPFNVNSGALQSPLSFAAQIAFENGANVIYTVALSGLGSTSDQYKSAYQLTETNNQINVIVPVFKTGTIADATAFAPFTAAFVAHLNTMENNGFPRVGLIGVPNDFSDGSTPDTIASSIGSRRVALVWPKELLYYNTSNNQTVTVGGTYLAAACAGILANNPVNQGLTRRLVRSFSGLTLKAAQASTTANKNLWSASGVAVAEVNRIGQLVVRHGTTTDPSTVVNRELSIVRCQDALFNVVQQSLDQAGLIGGPITQDTALAVKSIITGALEAAVATDTIQAYNSLSVRQQSLPNGDPTLIECLFAYQPTYPLNYITVVFSLDLSTGNLITTDSAGSSSDSADSNTATTTA